MYIGNNFEFRYTNFMASVVICSIYNVHEKRAYFLQMNTTFLLQGVHMKIRTNTPDANSTIIPAPWLTIADVAFVIVLIPILDKFVYPALERCGFRMTVLARISLGKTMLKQTCTL